MRSLSFSIQVFISISLILLVTIEASTSSIGPPPAVLPLKQPPPGEVFVQDDDYNQAAYGDYVLQSFKSTDVSVPRLNMMRPFTACEDDSYIFVTPRGEIVQHPTAAIYDSNGSLVWTPDVDFGEIYNFQVQTYKNEPHLVFWAGSNDKGHGEGNYYMVSLQWHWSNALADSSTCKFDKHYNLVRNISASNNLSADLHSFSITPQDTVLLTIYEKVKTDLSGILGKPSRFDQWMWDCLFQEFDLETGEVIFEWRASEHFEQKESYISHRPATSYDPWDMLHMNMVEKDTAGNYLVSLRHMRCIAYVSGKTGEVLWKLGGQRNMFKDLSDGEATNFVGQHDAHWDVIGQYLTLFDNRADWQDEAEHVSKGKRIEIDVENMTAKLNATYVHPENIFAFSQGSYQTLPNGNVLLGYGYTGALAEFVPNGTLLCDAYLQPSSRFSSGEVQSYRNLKFNWTGIPTTLPSVALEDQTLYVSWLGSTEVHTWLLQDSFEVDGDFDMVLEAPKSGFETAIILEQDLPLRAYVRLVALDIEHQELATSSPIDIGELATIHSEDLPMDDIEDEVQALKTEQRMQDLGALLGFGLMAMIATLLVLLVRAKPRGMTQMWRGRDKVFDAEVPSPAAASSWQDLMARLWRRKSDPSYELLPGSEVELHRTGG